MHNRWAWFFGVATLGALVVAIAALFLPLFTEKAGWLILGIAIGATTIGLVIPFVYYREGSKHLDRPRPAPAGDAPDKPLDVMAQVNKAVNDGRVDIARREAEMAAKARVIETYPEGLRERHRAELDGLKIEHAAARQKLIDAESQLAELKDAAVAPGPRPAPLKYQLARVAERAAKAADRLKAAETDIDLKAAGLNRASQHPNTREQLDAHAAHTESVEELRLAREENAAAHLQLVELQTALKIIPVRLTRRERIEQIRSECDDLEVEMQRTAQEVSDHKASADMARSEGANGAQSHYLDEVALGETSLRQQKALLQARQDELSDLEAAEKAERLLAAAPMKQAVRELKDEIVQLKLDIAKAEGNGLSFAHRAREARDMSWAAMAEEYVSEADQSGIVRRAKEERLKEAEAELLDLQKTSAAPLA